MTPEIGTLSIVTGTEQASSGPEIQCAALMLCPAHTSPHHAATERAPLEYSQERYITDWRHGDANATYSHRLNMQLRVTIRGDSTGGEYSNLITKGPQGPTFPFIRGSSPHLPGTALGVTQADG